MTSVKEAKDIKCPVESPTQFKDLLAIHESVRAYMHLLSYNCISMKELVVEDRGRRILGILVNVVLIRIGES